MATVTLASLESVRSELANSKYYLNIRSGYMSPVTLHCSYGDSGTQVTFYIFDAGEKMILDSTIVTIHGTRIDGANFGPFDCTVSDNAVTFTLQSSMTAVEGSGIAEFVITKNGVTVGTANFGILVENATFPKGVAYDSDPSVYQDILKYVQSMPSIIRADYIQRILDESRARIAGDATNSQNIATQTARIDNLIDQGTPVSDGELRDIRIGFDATTYQSAGEAVRKQAENAFDIRGKNITEDFLTRIRIGMVGSDGWIATSVTTQIAYYTKKLHKGDIIKIRDTSTYFFGRYCWYETADFDADNYSFNLTVISNATTYSIEIPTDGYYIVNIVRKDGTDVTNGQLTPDNIRMYLGIDSTFEEKRNDLLDLRGHTFMSDIITRKRIGMVGSDGWIATSNKMHIAYYTKKLHKGDIVKIKDTGKYFFSRYCWYEAADFNPDLYTYSLTIIYNTTTFSIEIPKDGYYIINITRNNYADVTDSEFATENLSMYLGVDTAYDKVSEIDTNLSNSGLIGNGIDGLSYLKWTDGTRRLCFHGVPIVDMDAYRPGLTLTFEDDFESMDTSVWRYKTGTPYNYTNLNYYDESAVTFENSNLVLTATKMDTPAQYSGYQDLYWKSGCINTVEDYGFGYGRLEAKIKITNELGTFPAFWGGGLSPKNSWPMAGEIDIFEKYASYTNAITTGLIYGEEINNAVNLGRVNNIYQNLDGYHVYSLVRNASYVDVYIDDIKINSVDITDSKYNMFKQPFTVILNLAIDGTPDPNMTETKMYVDWIRYYAE